MIGGGPTPAVPSGFPVTNDTALTIQPAQAMLFTRELTRCPRWKTGSSLPSPEWGIWPISVALDAYSQPPNEVVHQRRRAPRDEARRDPFAYIEGYDNRQRIHSALGYITPEQAERKAS